MHIKKKYFFSSVNYSHRVNELLVESCFNHYSKSSVEVTKIIFLDDYKRKIKLSDFLFILKYLLYGSLFKHNIFALNYKNFNLGRYALPATLRVYKTNLNVLFFYLILLKNLIKGQILIDSLLKIIPQISAGYIDHGVYINGLIFEIFSKFRIPIYHNNSPYDLVKCLVYNQSSFENFIKIPYSTGSILTKNLGEKKLKSVFNNVNLIPYMGLENFHNKNLQLKKYDYVVYAHSFIDAQCSYGFDGAFKSVLDWITFTLKILKNKKVCIKAHPNFYNTTYRKDVFEWDRKIFDEVKKLIKKYHEFDLIDFPYNNNNFLKKLDKKTILISHHGSSLLEGGYLGFKCICSSATAWANFDIFNVWHNKKEYIDILKLDFDALKKTNSSNLFTFYYKLTHEKNSLFKKNNWHKIIAESVGLKREDILKDPFILDNLKLQNIEKIINNVSGSIDTLNIN